MVGYFSSCDYLEIFNVEIKRTHSIIQDTAAKFTSYWPTSNLIDTFSNKLCLGQMMSIWALHQCVMKSITQATGSNK